MGLSIYLGWIARVGSWKIIIPLILLTFSIFWLIVACAGSVMSLLSRRKADQTAAVHLINILLSSIPCLYFFVDWLNFQGPRQQYLLQFLLR